MCILVKAQPRGGGIGVNHYQQRLHKNDYMQELSWIIARYLQV